MSRLQLIEKIHLLESTLGEKWNHSILEPFKFNSSDPIEVQNAGKKIAQHIGLPSLTFIISYAKQKSNVGGHIQLDSNSDVFIEIDDSLRSDSDIVLSVLAHEICHKYLQINNLQLFPELENELLTDAATVYTGLGKLSLNGCEKEIVSTTGTGLSSTTTTSTQKVGYMTRTQFAFIYRLVCEMRRIPEHGMLHGLSPEALEVVRKLSYFNNKYFDTALFNNEFAVKLVSDTIKKEINESQKSFAEFNRNIRIIQESIINAANQINKDFHTYSKAKIDELHSSANTTFTKDAHNYIKNLRAIEQISTFKENLSEKEREMNELGNMLPKFIADVHKLSPKQISKESLEFLLQFECPTCKNKMRIPEKKLARVKCSECNYSFIVDTGADKTAPSKLKIVWGKLTSPFRKKFN